MRTRLAVALATLLLAGQASATLVEIGIVAPGDATLDDLTGLIWLDVDLTTSRSYTDVAANGPGAAYGGGWRHATYDEVCALANNYGIGPLCGAPPVTTFQDGAPGENAALMTLLGTTSPPAAVDATNAYFDDTLSGNANQGRAELREFECCAPVVNEHTRLWVDFYDPATASSGIGHFLVRPVPEPETAALMVSGLIGLAAYRRHRKI